MKFILASTSPARLALLRSSGIEPELRASNVDEDEAVRSHEASLGKALTPSELVLLLARAKAEAVAAEYRDTEQSTPSLIFGGDSAFVLDDVIFGKPHLPEVAKARWLAQRGRTGTLYSGHWLIDPTADSRAVGAVASATVSFSPDITEAEIDAYIATGEPLKVAGAFTIDARGAAFISRIEGDPSTVIGMSLPTLRGLVRELGHEWTSLWG
ncbi:Maf family nucleotide pyrophosphatase [Lysinibacter cavernae]|uniref:Nucleoside triphosphate pyrophosphatase n=1 Tax=Lysinibacter cavernae TaxID=1640652 RepID=A0A7X5R3T3_9MICO|nr:septum formation protein [Lysinibacter cavernae]